MSSSLWNALETLIGSLASNLEESLTTNTEPDWEAVAIDVEAAQQMVYALTRAKNQADDARKATANKTAAK